MSADHATALDSLAPTTFARARRIALIAAAVGVALCALGFFINRGQLFQSWLAAHSFWLAFGLGGLAMLMTHHLMGGQWGVLAGRALEAMARTLPLLALLFVPLCFGLHDLYPWSLPHEAAASPHLQGKAIYLNARFFYIRAAGYFALWILFAWLFTRWSLRRDRDPSPTLSRRMLRASSLGLILYFLTMTFATVDWMMSIEPEWYSTIYGATVIVAQGMQALALAAIVIGLLARHPALAQLLTPKPMNDLGNMLMAFLMLWTYMAFAQYLIIWMGNLSEEVPWVIHRSRGGWEWIALTLIFVQFFLPFFILLFRSVKRRPELLARVAWWIIVMRWLTIHWLIAPTFHPGLRLHWIDLAALAAIGGLWTALFLRVLTRSRIVPLHDPRLHAAAAHAGRETHG